MADGVLCASSFTRWSLVHQGCEEQRIKVVPYGIFPQRLRRDLHTVDSRICRFLFIGQGVQRKGLHHLLKAWKLASLKQTELTVVAGRLDPGMQALLDQTGITYLPGVTSDVLEALYSQANVFVMPSLVEGFGFVYLEALAAGLHCVGTLNTGLPDLHLPSECVSIVPVGDIERLADTLTRCRDNFLHGRMDKTKIRSHMEELTWDRRRVDMRNVIAEMLRTA
jgi:glycosyltransferase involved in cell wall biosynthesis